jgi:hypothetical protein
MHAIHRVVSVQHLGAYTLRVEFDDGTERIADLEPILEGELFGPLRDPALFAAVAVDPEVQTIVWPNGADLDPAVLHDWPGFADEMAARASTWRMAPAECRYGATHTMKLSSWPW